MYIEELGKLSIQMRPVEGFPFLEDLGRFFHPWKTCGKSSIPRRPMEGLQKKCEKSFIHIRHMQGILSMENFCIEDLWKVFTTSKESGRPVKGVLSI